MIQTEITVTQKLDEDLFNHLRDSALSDISSFPVDIMDKEYIALPVETVASEGSLRSKIILIEAD